MRIIGSITYTGLSVAELEAGGLVGAFEKAEREAMIEAGEHWQKNILPKHFGRGASARYNYEPRSVKYLRRKAARQHTTRPGGSGKGTATDQNPLVFSGQSKRSILGDKTPPRYRRRHALKSVEVIINAPKHFFQYSKRGRIVDKGDEVTRLTDGELNELATMVQQGISERLDAYRARRRTRRVA